MRGPRFLAKILPGDIPRPDPRACCLPGHDSIAPEPIVRDLALCAPVRKAAGSRLVLHAHPGLHIVDFMKSTIVVIGSVLLLMCACEPARAQDPVVSEKLSRISGQVEDLQAANIALQKRVNELARELETLREQVSSTVPGSAVQEELKRLNERVKQLEAQCAADRELILRELEKLGKRARAGSGAAAGATQKPVTDSGTQGGTVEVRGYEYVVQPGDTLSAIVQAYRQNNIKVTVEQILKANPGLDANRLRVGQKIFIPAPQN